MSCYQIFVRPLRGGTCHVPRTADRPAIEGSSRFCHDNLIYEYNLETASFHCRHGDDLRLISRKRNAI